MSIRRSTHPGANAYSVPDVEYDKLLKVLWAAYGYTSTGNRSVPSVGGNYPLLIFIVNTTGCYQYIPLQNAIILHDDTITNEDVNDNMIQDLDSPTVLVFVWDKRIEMNQYFASAETGCLVQNVYLEALNLGLTTCSVGTINSRGSQTSLNLPSYMVPLLVMPLGYPITSYPPGEPNYAVMNGNLPPVQYSNMTLEEAIDGRVAVTEWSSEDLSMQELSQLLWAAYGSSNTSKRTTPSAYGIYPLVIYVLNETGTYKYEPERHSTVILSNEDKRSSIADVINSQTWIADAPTMFILSYDSSQGGDGSARNSGLDHEYIEINAGCVIQNIFLEATAWNLGTTIISDGLEEWNGIGGEGIRNIIDAGDEIIPLYVMPIGRINEKKQVKYLINAIGSSHGSISPSGNVTVIEGDNQTFTITPDSNFPILDVLVDSTSVGATSSFTFVNVTSNHTIVVFERTHDEYVISASSDVGGSISPSGEVAVDEGGDQTFTITPNLGYQVSEVIISWPSLYTWETGFEEGSLTGIWTEITDPGTLEIQSTITHSGNYAAKVNTSVGGPWGRVRMWPEGDIPGDLKQLNHRLYFYIDHYDGYIDMMVCYHTITGNNVNYIMHTIINSSGGVRLMRHYPDVAEYTYDANITTGRWYSLEHEIVVDPVYGSHRVWLDGVLILEETGVNNSGALDVGNQPKFGSVHYQREAGEAVFYIDDVRIDEGVNISLGPTSSHTFKNVATNYIITASFYEVPYPVLKLNYDTVWNMSSPSISLSGSLQWNNGTGIPDTDLRINYSNNRGESWYALKNATTQTNGDFITHWNPDTVGDFLISIYWVGMPESDIEGIEDIVQLSVANADEASIFMISNSTISSVSYYEGSKELSLILNGSDGKKGYIDIFMSKNVSQSLDELKVNLDDVETTYTLSDTSDVWKIHVEYMQSQNSRTMKILTESPLPPSNGNEKKPLDYRILILIGPIVIVVYLIYKFMRRRNFSSEQL